MKKLIIEICNHCRYFDSCMYGERCFHPKVVKPHSEGVSPKYIKYKDRFNIDIPKWCPLEDVK